MDEAVGSTIVDASNARIWTMLLDVVWESGGVPFPAVGGGCARIQQIDEQQYKQ